MTKRRDGFTCRTTAAGRTGPAPAARGPTSACCAATTMVTHGDRSRRAGRHGIEAIGSRQSEDLTRTVEKVQSNFRVTTNYRAQVCREFRSNYKVSRISYRKVKFHGQRP